MLSFRCLLDRHLFAGEGSLSRVRSARSHANRLVPPGIIGWGRGAAAASATSGWLEGPIVAGRSPGKSCVQGAAQGLRPSHPAGTSPPNAPVVRRYRTAAPRSASRRSPARPRRPIRASTKFPTGLPSIKKPKPPVPGVDRFAALASRRACERRNGEFFLLPPQKPRNRPSMV